MNYVAGPKKEYSEDCKRKLKEIIQMGRKTNSWFMAHSKVGDMMLLLFINCNINIYDFSVPSVLLFQASN